MEFKEIEAKYSAQDIQLEKFVSCMEALSPKESINVSSYDHYYLKTENNFIRYRQGSHPQLTMKEKMKDQNNYVRKEVNLNISTNEKLETVTEFCKMLGYEHNFTIYKTCMIYFWDNYNVVFYVVYDKNLHELDRFIEIEMKEDFPWESEEKAWDQLVLIEKELKTLGISPQKRIKRSLFEMFRKTPKVV